MDLSRYQELAFTTDQLAHVKGVKGLMVPLLGLAGESGGLLTEFKKKLRDPGYEVFKARVEEELGDLLWYLSNIASRQKLDLGAIASKNIQKNQERWPLDPHSTSKGHFDEDFPKEEQFPRRFVIEFTEIKTASGPRVEIRYGGEIIGDPLTDNAHYDDGYRFHDALHFANVAYLGWSPVARRYMKRKRKSDAQADRVEDGGRAAIIEESILAFVYNDAVAHDLYRATDHLDNSLLATIRSLVSGLEVNRRTTADWHEAILSGYRVFRYLNRHGGGSVTVDMKRRRLAVAPPRKRRGRR
jgi:NTP pyrophosphatase (non-canonical NTP hydrolase)